MTEINITELIEINKKIKKNANDLSSFIFEMKSEYDAEEDELTDYKKKLTELIRIESDYKKITNVLSAVINSYVKTERKTVKYMQSDVISRKKTREVTANNLIDIKNISSKYKIM